jgi:hypothetical protein
MPKSEFNANHSLTVTLGDTTDLAWAQQTGTQYHSRDLTLPNL